jgi:Mg2+ and Co2+ transporter CorA
MFKKMIEARIKQLFDELEKISKEVSEIEIEKQNATSIKKLTQDSLSKEKLMQIYSIQMQLSVLSSIIQEQKKC